MSFIGRIVREKEKEVGRKKRQSLIGAIRKAKKEGRNPVIAEIKQKSPSSGWIKKVDVPDAAASMERIGACAISVLTDKNFGGKPEHLMAVKSNTKIPILRKDFIVDEIQIYEAYVLGADCVLLIARILKNKTRNFVKLCHELGMEALVEVHDKTDLKYAMQSDALLIGINNRDLETLKIDLGTVPEIAGLIKKGKKGALIVAESGIKTRRIEEDMLKFADACIIGTAIMESENIEEGLRTFL